MRERISKAVKELNEKYDIDTIYLRSKDKGNISSSFVYNELLNGNDITEYVPASVKKLISK